MKQKTTTTKPAIPGDYIEIELASKISKYVTVTLIRGRRICLRGLSFFLTDEGGRLGLAPVIPACGKLFELLKRHPEWQDMTWTGKRWQVSKL